MGKSCLLYSSPPRLRVFLNIKRTPPARVLFTLLLPIYTILPFLLPLYFFSYTNNIFLLLLFFPQSIKFVAELPLESKSKSNALITCALTLIDDARSSE